MNQELLGWKAPTETCTDIKCPFHGQINVKNELFKGKIIKKDINHSATIEWMRPYYISKYERYEIRKSRLRVHNPPCLNAQLGQEVVVARTRPLSKTKNHVVIQILTDSKIKPSTSDKETPATEDRKSKKQKK